MKIKGSELQEFMDKAWPGTDKPETYDDFYWDHDQFDTPKPDEEYDTDDLGPLIYQGRGDDPSNGGYNLEKLIKAWRKDRDFEIITIQVPKGIDLTELKAFLKKVKGRITK